MKPIWIVAAVPLLVAALVAPAIVLAHSESGFDGVVGAIETRYHVHATRIPFMGLIGMIGRAATHGGVGRIKVADFEDFHAQVDGAELDRIVEERLGSGWQIMVRETSRKGGNQTLIFVRPEGDRMGMFIVDRDTSELNVVEVSVDPAHLAEQINQHEHHRDHEESGDGASD